MARVPIVSAASTAVRFRSSRGLYLGMALAALVTIAIGFAPSFYLRPRSLPPLPPVVVAHGVIFTAWIVVFVVQTSLITTGHTAIHRRLGFIGMGLAGVMLVMGPLIAISAARRGVFPGDPLAFLLVPLMDVVLFAACVGLAYHYRRRSELHKRWMLLAVASLLPPAISRWPIASNRPMVVLWVVLLFVAARAIADLVTGTRVHPVTLWGGLCLLASLPLRFAVAQTEGWHRVARWLTGT
jgi:hypothetical protein